MTTDNDLIRRGGVRKEINRALAWSPYAGGTTESVAFREGGVALANIIDEAIAAIPAASPDALRAEYLRGWNDAMASIPKRIIDDPAASGVVEVCGICDIAGRHHIRERALAAKAFDASQTHDPVLRPTMTDLMVDPDALDGFMEANPLPPDPVVNDPRVKALVEAAYAEGFSEGADGGWIEGDYSKPWAKSAALHAIEGEK